MLRNEIFQRRDFLHLHTCERFYFERHSECCWYDISMTENGLLPLSILAETHALHAKKKEKRKKTLSNYYKCHIISLPVKNQKDWGCSLIKNRERKKRIKRCRGGYCFRRGKKLSYISFLCHLGERRMAVVMTQDNEQEGESRDRKCYRTVVVIRSILSSTKRGKISDQGTGKTTTWTDTLPFSIFASVFCRLKYISASSYCASHVGTQPLTK